MHDPAPSADTAVVGVLLAGGQSRRMGGGDKCLRPLAGRPLLDHVIARAQPQVAHLILNANGAPARFAAWDLPVVADVVPGSAGPLAGVLSGLEWAAAHAPGAAWVATFATDAPFLPVDLVARLLAATATAGAAMACAGSGGRSHPVFGLWPVAERAALRRAIVTDAVRKVDLWTGCYQLVTVDFPAAPVDPFFNANRPDDLAVAERLLAGTPRPPSRSPN